jgi:hypothetical protein
MRDEIEDIHKDMCRLMRMRMRDEMLEAMRKEMRDEMLEAMRKEMRDEMLWNNVRVMSSKKF